MVYFFEITLSKFSNCYYISQPIFLFIKIEMSSELNISEGGSPSAGAHSPNWTVLETSSPREDVASPDIPAASEPGLIESLRGQIREPRDISTGSDDFAEPTRVPQSPTTATASTSAVFETVAETKISRRMKATSQPREGHPEDENFVTVSLIPARENLLGNQIFVDEFYDELVAEGFRDRISREVLSLLPPDISDRAHDSDKGLCVYWKMPRCGFSLPLSDFEKALLRALDVTPAQLTSTTWCTITSFELIFEEFWEELGGVEPTVPIFTHFFTIAVATKDFLTVRKRLKGPELFDISRNPQLQRIDGWNEGWAYIPHPDKVFSLKDIRRTWRVLDREGKPSFNFEMNDEERRIADLVENLAEC